MKLKREEVVICPERIKAIRFKLNETQTQFAERIGVSDFTIISSWENGHSKPGNDKILKIKELEVRLQFIPDKVLPSAYFIDIIIDTIVKGDLENARNITRVYTLAGPEITKVFNPDVWNRLLLLSAIISMFEENYEEVIRLTNEGIIKSSRNKHLMARFLELRCGAKFQSEPYQKYNEAKRTSFGNSLLADLDMATNLKQNMFSCYMNALRIISAVLDDEELFEFKVNQLKSNLDKMGKKKFLLAWLKNEINNSKDFYNSRSYACCKKMMDRR